MAPRAFINRIDSVRIFTSPKCSCRSVSDFAWEVDKTKTINFPVRINILVARNPYKRLVSGYLNKYVEHVKYLERAKSLNPRVDLSTFHAFVGELCRSRFRYIDRVHFSPQFAKYRFVAFDRVFNSENLEPLRLLVNTLFSTQVEMPYRVHPKFGPKNQASETTPPGHSVDQSDEPWNLAANSMLALITEKRTPPYSQFYTDDLKDRVRRFYRSDFRFLEACLERGIIDQAFHRELSML